MARTHLGRRAALAGVAIGATLALAPSAPATFPGDNGAIAFTRAGDIWTVQPDGSGERRLTGGPAQDSNPEWTPDGRGLYFERDGEVWRIGADGSDAGRITTGEEPQLSGDGARLAYRRGDEVVAVNLFDFNDEWTETEANLARVDDWAPTHSLLLYTLTDGDSLFVGWSPEGARASWGFLHDDRHLSHLGPSWSPDGTKIAFHRTHSGIGPCLLDDPTCPPDPHLGLVTMDIGGGAYTVVHPRGTQPAWSPDGTRIAYVNGDMLQVIRADGSGRRTLGKGAEPDWQPLEPGAPEPKVVERVVTVPGPTVTMTAPPAKPRVITRRVVEECQVPKGARHFTVLLRAHRSIRAGMGLKVSVDLDSMKATVKKGKRLRLAAGVR